jgi:epoxyqueuosine reductase
LLKASPEILKFSKSDWDEITYDTFQQVFKNSALKRSKFEGVLRNINFLKEY